MAVKLRICTCSIYCLFLLFLLMCSFFPPVILKTTQGVIFSGELFICSATDIQSLLSVNTGPTHPYLFFFFHGLNTFLLYFLSHWFNKTGTDRWTRCQFKHDAVASGPFFFEAKRLQGIPSVWVWSWKPTLYKWSPRVWVCGCGFLLCICSSCSFTAFFVSTFLFSTGFF